jgi:hypothetical protein
MKDLNGDDFVLSSSGVVLEVNERGNFLNKNIKYIVEITSICYPGWGDT